MNNSFYGGQPGRSLTIKHVFRNKVEMADDLKKRWQSDIGVEDLVFISYGLPSTQKENSSDTYYMDNVQIDLNAYHKNYNSTLWKKFYRETSKVSDGINNTPLGIEPIDSDSGLEEVFIENTGTGLGYQLIASFTGNTPKIILDPNAGDGNGTTVLNANEKPYITLDLNNTDEPKLHFHLPQSQVMILDKTQVLNADEKPYSTLDESNINRPTIKFYLPQSQVIRLGTVESIPSNQNPQVSIDSSNINNPAINYKLPLAQLLQQGQTVVLDADRMPSFVINSSDPTYPEITFSLPQNQIQQNPDSQTIGAMEKPHVTLDSSDINKPKYTFYLPKAIKFYYGDKLGERTQKVYTIEKTSELMPLMLGDVYINEGTGFIYEVTRIGETYIEFTYEAQLTAPIPDVDTTPINPYITKERENDDGEIEEYLDLNVPSIVSEYKDDIEKTGWQLNFHLPKPPNITHSFDFIGASEKGSVESFIDNETDYKFAFKIPKGSRMYSGTELPEDNNLLYDAQLGDYYLQNDIGDLFQLEESGWVKIPGSLKGPIGDTLKIVASYFIDSDQVVVDETAEIGAYIQHQYGGTPEPDEVIAVIYKDLNNDGIETSYWYYYLNGSWERVVLTGGLDRVIKNDYNNNDDTKSFVYSAEYINNLVVNEPVSPSEEDKKVYSIKMIHQLFDEFKEANTLRWVKFGELNK